jgi:hypothetical protein
LLLLLLLSFALSNKIYDLFIYKMSLSSKNHLATTSSMPYDTWRNNALLQQIPQWPQHIMIPILWKLRLQGLNSVFKSFHKCWGLNQGLLDLKGKGPCFLPRGRKAESPRADGEEEKEGASSLPGLEASELDSHSPHLSSFLKNTAKCIP